MSWDALIFNGTGVPKSLDEVPKDWAPPPLGNPEDIRARLTESLPEIQWVPDREYGAIEAELFTIELRVPEERPLMAITVRVVGGGDPIPVLVNLCKPRGWVVFDNQIGDLLDSDADPTKSWKRFVAWRDRIS